MIRDFNSSASDEGGELQLQELYSLYLQFSKDLRDNRVPGYTIREFPEFKEWWNGLADDVRERCIYDYRTGYRQLLSRLEERTMWGR